MIRKLLITFATMMTLACGADAQWKRTDLDWGAFGYSQMAINSPKKGVAFIVSCQVRGTEAGKLYIETKLDTGTKASDVVDLVDYVVGPQKFSLRAEIRRGDGWTVIALSADPLETEGDSVYDLVNALSKASVLTVRQSRLGIASDFAIMDGATPLAGLDRCRSHYLNRSAAVTPEGVAEEILIAARQSCLAYVTEPHLMNASLSTAWWEQDLDMAKGFNAPNRKVIGGWRYRRGPVDLIAIMTQASNGMVNCLIAHKGQTRATFARLQTLIEQSLRVSNRTTDTRNRVTVVDYLAQLNRAEKAMVMVSYSEDDQQTWFQVTSR